MDSRECGNNPRDPYAWTKAIQPQECSRTKRKQNHRGNQLLKSPYRRTRDEKIPRLPFRNKLQKGASKRLTTKEVNSRGVETSILRLPEVIQDKEARDSNSIGDRSTTEAAQQCNLKTLTWPNSISDVSCQKTGTRVVNQESNGFDGKSWGWGGR